MLSAGVAAPELPTTARAPTAKPAEETSASSEELMARVCHLGLHGHAFQLEVERLVRCQGLKVRHQTLALLPALDLQVSQALGNERGALLPSLDVLEAGVGGVQGPLRRN